MHPRTPSHDAGVCALIAAVLLTACGAPDDKGLFGSVPSGGSSPASGGKSGTGGSTTTGGTSSGKTGGASSMQTGGVSSNQTGGAATGGAAESGGKTSTGGLSASGGTSGSDSGGTGGSAQEGGTGGADPTGGVAGTAGQSNALGGVGAGGGPLGGGGGVDASGGSAGTPGGAGGAGGEPGCMPEEERCNGLDDDCNDEADDEDVCDADCEGFALGDHGYMYCAMPANAENASGECEEQGLRLAWIESEPENAQLLEVLDGLVDPPNVFPPGLADRPLVLFGAGDGEVELEWRWLGEGGFPFWTGGPANQGGEAVDGAYENWATGQPNDDGNEDCSVFVLDDGPDGNAGEWNDGVCGTPRPFLCETP